MDTDKRMTFVRYLKDRTEDGKLSWRQGAFMDSFIAGFPEYAVTVFPSGIGRDTRYNVTIHDSSGRLVDKFTDRDIDSDQSVAGFDCLDRLFEILNGKEHRAEMALDELIESMK